MTTDTPDLPERCCGRCKYFGGHFCRWMSMAPSKPLWLDQVGTTSLTQRPTDGESCPAFVAQQQEGAETE